MIKEYPLLRPTTRDTFINVNDYTLYGITVPAGYETNGASVPRIFWWIYPPNYPGRITAAMLHDYLTDNAYTKYDFYRSDLVLYRALLDSGQPKITAKIFYIACRLYHIVKYCYID